MVYTKVLSPIDGIIGRSSVTEGALVTANQATALAAVQQIDPIYVDVTQSSVQLLRLQNALSSGQLKKAEGEQAAQMCIRDSGAAEQAQAHGPFQFGHLARQCRFGYSQGGGRTAKTVRLGDLHEELHAL